MQLKIKHILFNLEFANSFNFFSAVCRVFICFHILKKLFSQRNFFDIIYRGTSFLIPDNSEFSAYFINGEVFRQYFTIYLLVYLCLTVFYLFGIGKNWTALGVFLCLEIQQRLCHTILNGGDNLFKFLVLYMIFINSFDFFCLKKYSKPRGAVSNLISNIAGYSICIHLCLVYFISAIHKIHADVWFNGVANYYILSSERFRGTSFNLSLAKNGTFVTVTTYFTICVELIYPFLVWIKRTKVIMLILATILHIGIYVFMMIYDFQIVFIIIQGFFISNENWLSFYNTLSKRFSLLKMYAIQKR